MRFFLTFLLTVVYALNSYTQLNTKFIAANYSDGIVKIILFDPELEEKKPGLGYLSRGSGFFVTEDGYIFTNRHVVESCVTGYVDYDYYDTAGKKKAGFAPYSEELIENKNFIKAYRTGYPIPIVQVFTGTNENDYKLYNAEVVSIGMGAFDGALLRIISDEQGNTSGFRFTAVPLGDSDQVTQGEQFCVYGYPAQVKGGADLMLRDMSTLSRGIMSGFDFVFNNDYGYMKTDAEIHPGNSGGPVFNEENKAIGIATSKGVATGIGLVGGVNGMYYIAASDAKALEKLRAKGLRTPKRAFSINTVTGKKQPMKTLDEINGSAAKSSNGTSTTDYSSARIYFSNASPKDNNNLLPPKSKQYTSFTISRKNGGVVWIFVDCYPGKLNTPSIAVLVDKMKNGKFQKYKDLSYTVASPKTGDNTYFSFTFTEKGTYRFTAYSKELKKIASNTVTISYK
ncbi:S1C family serine protease [Flagellimonas allohymeniacidonis]|uniref:Serine protease n=1 Tax=Flagellimonas allohymeniacidonis TaxID=2517819 RepID=A0A4Q8QBV5_9FLAO|nr:serine protease [Allomuricauda hymeniacidonis]TAI47862.1 serine protease [Allomuricauda hymeniacidonis]